MSGTPDATDRYEAAMHAVQTGIALLIERGDTLATPKHLRVGINSAMVTDSAIATLLIEKGVFTEAEYRDALAAAAEREQAFILDEVRKHYGDGINLG